MVLTKPCYHQNNPDWRLTPEGERRGYIQPQSLTELWFHTGTNCNLQCPFCFEGARPGNRRLQAVQLTDLIPLFDEARQLGVKQFSFTGGEPFVNAEIIDILEYGLTFKPCLVLTNGTTPLLSHLKELQPLIRKPHHLSFRISLDAPDAEIHDAHRGKGTFALALRSLAELHHSGFKVSVARHKEDDEDSLAVNEAYRPLFIAAGIPEDTSIVAFTELFQPGSQQEVPHITEHCMTTYKTQSDREAFMCSYSKMVVKKDGQTRVYACTLVDDDTDYDLGPSLTQAMQYRIMLRHHRCFGCFAAGTSCSEAH